MIVRRLLCFHCHSPWDLKHIKLKYYNLHASGATPFYKCFNVKSIAPYCYIHVEGYHSTNMPINQREIEGDSIEYFLCQIYASGLFSNYTIMHKILCKGTDIIFYG